MKNKQTSEKCECEEMSCNFPCHKKHTCKTFWCEKCQPKRYQKIDSPSCPSALNTEPVKEDWEASIREIFYHIVAWMEDEGEYQPTQEEAENKVKEIIQSLLSQERKNGIKEGILQMEKPRLEVIAQERQKLREMVESMKVKEDFTPGTIERSISYTYNQALSDLIKKLDE